MSRGSRRWSVQRGAGPVGKAVHPVVAGVVETKVVREFPADDQFLQKGFFGVGRRVRSPGLPGPPAGRRSGRSAGRAKGWIGRPAGDHCGRRHRTPTPFRQRLSRPFARPFPGRKFFYRAFPGSDLQVRDRRGQSVFSPSSFQKRGVFSETGKSLQIVGQKTLDFGPQGVGPVFLFGGSRPAGNEVVGIHFVKRNFNSSGDL